MSKELPALIEAGAVKKSIYGIKEEAGYFKPKPPKIKVNANEIYQQQFEAMYGKIISVDLNKGKIITGVLINNQEEETAFCGYYTSTTIQKLGVFLSDLVIKRSSEAAFKEVITPEIVKKAEATKIDLEQRL